MHGQKKSFPYRKALFNYLLLPDAVRTASVGSGARIIRFPAAVSMVFHVGAIRIIRNIVSAICVVIDAAVVGAVYIAPVQIVGQAGAVIVEGGIGAVIIACVISSELTSA